MEEMNESGEDEMAVAIERSLGEDEQVRLHGKVSGLHLLEVRERNEGGLWQFLQWLSHVLAPRLPDLATQELVLKL
ncbi:hypothetical protein BD311DRAFT_807048 [Dichomitus squalens]|uniref:Uncharacterized protein n=1 Tax=Dichomitus squalens TaxID=114155 RepID=A0A4Q9MLR5_9APHY|nr:hypothetical protein BD311DRAFT_807048 [Dichomitus squalens]